MKRRHAPDKAQIVERAHAIAKATFPNVRDYTAHCLTLNGAIIAAAAEVGVRLVLQAGSAYWPCLDDAHDDGTSPNQFGYEWNDQGRAIARMLGLGLMPSRMPEIHVWAGNPDTQELVDISTGAWPEQAKRLIGTEWRAPMPPKFYWGHVSKLPRFVNYTADREATMFAARMLTIAIQNGGGDDE